MNKNNEKKTTMMLPVKMGINEKYLKSGNLDVKIIDNPFVYVSLWGMMLHGY